MAGKPLKIKVSDRIGSVSGIWLEPARTQCALVFAHGAGADMTHLFMEGVASNLADQGVATLRFNFPYMEAGKRSPDPKSVLLETIVAALVKSRDLTTKPVWLGGKSLGGRMASWVMAEGADVAQNVKGLVFFGFPLHAPGKVSTERADHLKTLKVPMLFLQGTRDSLADIDSIQAVCNGLGKRATLEIIAGGDHSFKTPAGMKLDYQDTIADLARRVARWTEERLGR